MVSGDTLEVTLKVNNGGNWNQARTITVTEKDNAGATWFTTSDAPNGSVLTFDIPNSFVFTKDVTYVVSWT